MTNNIIRVTGPSGISLLEGSSGVPGGSGQNYQLDSTGSVYIDPRDLPALLEAGFEISEFPATARTLFGGAAAGATNGAFNEAGNLNVQISSAGVSPGATAADNVIAVATLPANVFNAANRGILISAAGSFAATANNKRVKIIVNPATAVVGSTVGTGGTTICDTGTVATNGAGWQLQGSVFKYGIAGSNTQIGIHNQAQIGAAVASMLAPSLITATESGAILVAITGNATTATTDIVFNWLEISAMN